MEGHAYRTSSELAGKQSTLSLLFSSSVGLDLWRWLSAHWSPARLALSCRCRARGVRPCRRLRRQHFHQVTLTAKQGRPQRPRSSYLYMDGPIKPGYYRVCAKHPAVHPGPTCRCRVPRSGLMQVLAGQSLNGTQLSTVGSGLGVDVTGCVPLPSPGARSSRGKMVRRIRSRGAGTSRSMRCNPPPQLGWTGWRQGSQEMPRKTKVAQK